MGIIIRQSIKGTVVVYAGVTLAFFINLYIFPLCFSIEQIGLLRVISELGVFIAGLAAVGMQTSAVIRFYPYFQDKEKGNNGFFWLITLIPLAGFLIFVIGFYLFENAFISIYKDDSPLLAQYSYLLIPISFGIMLSTTYETYANANLRIVVPKIIREIALRLFIILAAAFFYFDYIDFYTFSWGYSVINIIAAFLIVFYLGRLGQLYFGKIRFTEPTVGKEITKYGFYMFLGAIGSLLVNNIDALMIAASPNGDANNGIYLTAVLLTSMIELPGRSLGQISAPIVSTHMKDGNLKEVGKLYKDTSITQLSVGCLLFALLWSNIDNVFAIMPKGEQFEAGKICVLFIGISQLFNMTTSINGAILGLSKYYKFGFYVMLGMGVISFFVNYTLIPIYGITGAAIARAINIFLYQFIIFFVLYLKTKLSPFSNKTILPILIMGIALIASYFMPHIINEYVDLIVRSAVVLIIFVGLSLWFNVSPYFKQILDKALVFLKLKNE